MIASESKEKQETLLPQMETTLAESARAKYYPLDQNVEDEEEAISLCDLPVKEENRQDKENQESASNCQWTTEEDEFEFRPPWAGGGCDLSAMLAADDLFFQGRILPLQFSASFECGVHDSKFAAEDGSKCVSRSMSMDHVGSSSTVTNRFMATRATKPRKLNNFHSFPSPKPQIRPSTATTRANATNYRTRKSVPSSSSSIWEFLRIGVVRTPDMELHDLKVRCASSSSASTTTVSRNSSSNSSSDNSNSTIKSFSSDSIEMGCGSGSSVLHKSSEKQRKQSFSLSGCSCSRESAVNPVQLKTNNKNSVTRSDRDGNANFSIEEKMKELKLGKNKEEMKALKMQEKEALLGQKQDMSCHSRTFEWIKQLSSHNNSHLSSST